MDFKWVSLLMCSIAFANSQDINKSACTFAHDKLTYLCSGIVDAFPSMYYGAYNIKCTGCVIPVFQPGTFPGSAEIPSFNLSSSGIENITSGAFDTLPKLRYLYLQNNKIFAIEPGAFKGLTQIYELNLENNEITHITPGMFNGLNALAVHSGLNHIKEIPPGSFEGVDQIITFNLSFNDIAILHMDSFKGLQNMEILDLQHNKICYIPLGLFQYSDVLKGLDLKGNKLRYFLPGTFSGLKRLLTINLANNEFSEFDPSLLLPMSSIYYLDISRNNLYYLDSQSLHASAPTVKLLMLKDNLWDCPVLTNLIRYFKGVGVDTFGTGDGRYDVTNINGIMCVLGTTVTYAMPFNYYMDLVKASSDKNINYC